MKNLGFYNGKIDELENYDDSTITEDIKKIKTKLEKKYSELEKEKKLENKIQQLE